MSAGITVGVQDAITSGQDFDMTLTLDDPTTPGTFVIDMTVNGAARSFAVKLGTHPATPVAATQSVKVGGANTWIVTAWGAASSGSTITMTATEVPAGTRGGSGSGAVL